MIKKDKTVSARFSKEAYRQLKSLSKKWGENLSRTLIRCISIVYHQQKD